MSIIDILLLLALLLTAVFSAFFSGIETGIISLNRIGLKRREEAGERNAVILGKLLRKPEKLIASILVGNNIANVSATMIFLIWASRMWSSSLAHLLTPLVVTPLLLVFGELLPKATFRHKADSLAPVFSPLLRVFVIIFSPVVGTLTRITRRVTSFLGAPEGGSPFMSREDVRLLFAEGEEQGIIEEDDRELIHGVIDFGTTTVREVIVPRIDVDAVRDNATWEEVCEAYEANGHSRLPVFHEKIDDVVGILYIFDLMRAGKPPDGDSILDFIRPVTFVPLSKRIHELLHEFQSNQTFMAIAVDEYGGTAGIVTLEDLIEEIFGEIHDEYDVQELPVSDVGEGLFVLDARMHKDEAQDLVGIVLGEGEYETVGGFVFAQLGRVPRKGETFQFNDFQVTVLEATERVVKRVKFKRSPLKKKRSFRKKK